MVSLEVLQTVRYERTRQERAFGLIRPDDIEQFRIPPIDDCELIGLDLTFDEICANTAQGFAEFDGDTIRFDIKHESGTTWVRSISMFQGYENDQEIWMCISRISDYENNNHFIEKHPYSIDTNGVITEPSVGSSEVTPGTFLDILKLFRAAEEARPISTMLSESA